MGPLGNLGWVSVFFMWEGCDLLGARGGTVIDSIMVPKDVHMLISGTCEYVTLHGKSN